MDDGVKEQVKVAVALETINGIRRDVTDIQSSMRTLADSMTKLAVVEARQIENAGAIGRAFAEITQLDIATAKADEALSVNIGKIEERLRKVETAEPTHALANGFLFNAMKWLLAAFVGAAITIFAANQAGRDKPPAAPQVTGSK